MKPTLLVEIVTPKKFVLKGLWFGPKKARRVFVWVHGLGSSVFGNHALVQQCVDADTAVLVFNNRGHDSVSKLRHVDPKKSIIAGAAHEIFTDCVDDIAGALNTVRAAGAREVYLVGHSTGCQKSVYYASKKKDPLIKGIVLLAPVSDYASFVATHGKAVVSRAIVAANALMKRGSPHTLMPEDSCGAGFDAQRFLSLYTPDSFEEIFPYAQTGVIPRILRGLRTPVLVVWAGADEHVDRPSRDVAEWFGKEIRSPHEVVTIANATHDFRDAEKLVAKAIRKFIERL